MPARSVAAAGELLDQLDLSADLVIANQALPGLETFVSRLRQSRSNLKVILLRENPADLTNIDADEYRVKPSRLREDSADEWLWIVRKVLLALPTAINQ